LAIAANFFFIDNGFVIFLNTYSYWRIIRMRVKPLNGTTDITSRLSTNKNTNFTSPVLQVLLRSLNSPAAVLVTVGQSGLQDGL
jgi:hypothetical protein